MKMIMTIIVVGKWVVVPVVKKATTFILFWDHSLCPNNVHVDKHCQSADFKPSAAV